MSSLNLQKCVQSLVPVTLFCCISTVMAGGDPSVPEPPTLPDPVQSGEAFEPEVSIVIRDDATVTEYRINGNLYMVKVTPTKSGQPYYLIDRDGDGEMEERINDIYQEPNIPQWVLFSW